MIKDKFRKQIRGKYGFGCTFQNNKMKIYKE